MPNNAIQENIDIWDKWSYDTENECFVFFTLHDEWEGENCFYCRFKAKAWLNGKFSDFIQALKNEENQRTFTSNTETYTVKCTIQED